MILKIKNKLKTIYFLSSFVCILIGCVSKENNDLNNIYLNPNIDENVQLESNHSKRFEKFIDLGDITNLICEFSDDTFQGRATGESGQKKAANFIKKRYEYLEIESPLGIDYFQKIPSSYFKGKSNNDSENVFGIIKGKELPNEYIILSAHYDHLGITGSQTIYNGADDNGSGSIALLEIAEAFKKAEKQGVFPKRSILFFHTTGEEIGIFGSKFYVENPIYPLENTIANINIDMIGRVDRKHENEPNYLYVIGSNRLSTDLHTVAELVNRKYCNFNLDYSLNGLYDKNRFYEKSDHFHFAKNNIPVIFYFNGLHEDFHKPSDVPDNIEFNLLTDRTKYIFNVVWELANRKEKPKLD